MSKTKFKIYIVVHKGNPVDFIKFRHTGIWCVPKDGSSHYYYHVRGMTGRFIFERRKNFNPTTTRTFAKKVKVGTTRHPLTPSELATQMESVPVANDDPEFDCKQWVDHALRTLCRANYLTAEQYDTGMDKMTEATMEAEDEGLAY